MHSSQNSFLLYLQHFLQIFVLVDIVQFDQPEPLNKAVLVDELDGTGAYTGVEEGPLGGAFATTYSADVWGICGGSEVCGGKP